MTRFRWLAAVALMATLSGEAWADTPNPTTPADLALLEAANTDEAFQAALVQQVAQGRPTDAAGLARNVENIEEFHERRSCVSKCRHYLRAILELDEATGSQLIRAAITKDGERAPAWAADMAHIWVSDDSRLRRAVRVPVEAIAALADNWLATGAARCNDASQPKTSRDATLRLGTTLIAALAAADFPTARKYFDAYRRRALPLPVLAEALAQQASGSREIAEYLLSLKTSEALDAYLAMGVLLPQAEPALTQSFVLCPQSSAQWTQHCSAIHRQLTLLDTPNARKAIAGTERPMTESESSAQSYRAYRHASASRHFTLALATVTPALVLSGSGIWQLAAWQDAGQPSAARTPLVTLNGGLTGGAVLGTGAVLAIVIAAKGGSDTRDGGFGLAAAVLSAGLLGAGLGALGGSTLSYELRDNRAYYQTIAVSEIIWPLIAAGIIYATHD